MYNIINKFQMGWSALHIAVLYNQIECVRLLLKHGADINACDYVSMWMSNVQIYLYVILLYSRDCLPFSSLCRVDGVLSTMRPT